MRKKTTEFGVEGSIVAYEKTNILGKGLHEKFKDIYISKKSCEIPKESEQFFFEI